MSLNNNNDHSTIDKQFILDHTLFEQKPTQIALNTNASIDNFSQNPSTIQTSDTQLYILKDETRERLLKAFKPSNKDLKLKLLGKLLYNRKGYYCELECKLFDESYYEKYRKEQVSDIDIFGIKFEEDLKCIRFGIECKSTSANGIDEVLKIKGIQALNNFDYVGLLKKNIANNVRQVANKIDVHVNSEAEISKMVESIIPNSSLSLFEENKVYSLSNGIETELKNSIKGAINFVKGFFWTNKPYENIHTLVRLIEHTQEQKLPDYQLKYIMTKYSILLSLSLLEVSSKIVKSDFSNIQSAALDQLLGGPSLRWEKARTYDLLSQELGKKLSPFPYYTKDYANVVSWILQDMPNAMKVTACLEQYLICFLLGKNLHTEMTSFSDSTLKLSKDMLRFTSKILKRDELFIDIFKI